MAHKWENLGKYGVTRDGMGENWDELGFD